MKMIRQIEIMGLVVKEDTLVDIELENGTLLKRCEIDVENTMDCFSEFREDNEVYLFCNSVFLENEITQLTIDPSKIQSIKESELQVKEVTAAQMKKDMLEKLDEIDSWLHPKYDSEKV